MQPLNNLDVVILFITIISAVIAFFRGFVKEVMTIAGWILASVSVFYMLPILTPITKNYIESSTMASIVTALVVLIMFYYMWVVFSDKLIGKVRSGKLSTLDRMLGLAFGIIRAGVVVVLFYILVSWVVPEDKDGGIFKGSRYFKFAGEFAAPIEALIPRETKDLIKNKGLTEEEAKDTTEENEDEEKEGEKNDEKTPEQTEMDKLFEKLAQPQIEKATDNLKDEKQDFDGYKENQTDNLDKLIDTVVSVAQDKLDEDTSKDTLEVKKN